MVDHVEFAQSSIVDNFLHFWRETGNQRFGYLIGSYQLYDKVPLGIKAVVEAIYEPEQTSSSDFIQLSNVNDLPDDISNDLKLQVVGMIFTDLIDDGTSTGKVICKRHVNSYFLSSAECILSAKLQLKYPTLCKWGEAGFYASRFVTCIVTGIIIKIYI